MKKQSPLFKNINYMLHGGDYNPDQWLDYSEIIEKDFSFMDKAHCNTFSVGIFAWTSYEKTEGVFDFSWLDMIMDKMAACNKKVFLATPSGARPAWMAKKYPEVCRMNEQGIRAHFAWRHNHCWSSPVYRAKVAEINRRLAQRYANHPALAGWHISNEYSGFCYCPLCKANFRKYLEKKFKTIENFNKTAWSAFWNHTYSDWDEIEVDDRFADTVMLEFQRFNTYQVCDFMQHEVNAVREFSDAPVTTNMMGTFQNLDYHEVAKVCDFISDDCYPGWQDPEDMITPAVECAFVHDLHRCMKKKPFILMESTPSNLNWKNYYRLKRPGLHRSESLLAIAHGADGVMYFQFRKGMGGGEKFHGAVIDHANTDNTRVFRDVADVGKILENLAGAVGSKVVSETAIFFDWQSLFALKHSSGPSAPDIQQYTRTVIEHYKALWQKNIPVDVISPHDDISTYKVVIAPMLFLLDTETQNKLKEFTANGGVLVSTYLSFYVDEYNRVFNGGLPGGGLREVFGIWQEELDGLAPNDKQHYRSVSSNSLDFDGTSTIFEYAERIHPEGAEVLAVYGDDFYANEAALTVNKYGKGYAYYQAARGNADFLDEFYSKLTAKYKLKSTLPDSGLIHASLRENANDKYLFVFNFTNQTASCKCSLHGTSLVDGSKLNSELTLPPCSSQVYLLSE